MALLTAMTTTRATTVTTARPTTPTRTTGTRVLMATTTITTMATGHSPGHGHDHNFSAAYLHVLADAFTSLLAIAALAGGAWYGLNWLDPVVALLGAVVIAKWAWRMLGSTARALVDATEDPALAQQIRGLIEADGDAKLTDLHVWQVGGQAWCAALSVVADAPLPAATYRQRLAGVQPLRHITVEVHRCVGAHPRPDGL
jgi:cation diffusion facilitator family transporter